jgi:hypothetical protein
MENEGMLVFGYVHIMLHSTGIGTFCCISTVFFCCREL